MALMGAVAVWGVNFAVVKHAVSNAPILPFLFVRFVIATFCLLPLAWRTVQKDPHRERVSIRTAVYAGLALFLAYGLQAEGLRHAQVAVGALLTNLFVVFVPLILLIAQPKKRPTRRESIGVGVALLAVLVLSRDGQFAGDGALPLIGCALCYAGQIVLLSSRTEDSNPAVFTAIQIGVVTLASMLTLIPSLFRDGWPEVEPSFYLAASFSGVMGTAVGYYLQTVAQGVLRASPAAVMLSMESVFAALAGALLLGESVSGNTLIGGVMILGAILVCTAR